MPENENNSSKSLAWGKLLQPIALALVTGWLSYITITGQGEMREQAVNAMHTPEEDKRDSLKFDKFLDSKLPEKMFVVAGERLFGIKNEQEKEVLGNNVHTLSKTNLDTLILEIKVLKEENKFLKERLSHMFGFGIIKGERRFFVTPYLNEQELFNSIPDGRDWLEPCWWYPDERGTVQADPSLKNIKHR